MHYTRIYTVVFTRVLVFTDASGSRYFKEVVRRMNALSAQFESLAIGVLDLCYYEDSMKAQALLRVRSPPSIFLHFLPLFLPKITVSLSVNVDNIDITGTQNPIHASLSRSRHV